MIDFITWTANPILATAGAFTVRWYGLMFAIGFLVGYYIVDKMYRREGAPEQWVSYLFFYVIIATILGARLGHVFFYAWDYYSAHPMEIFAIWEGGLASHGGTLGIIIAIAFYSKYVTGERVLTPAQREVKGGKAWAWLVKLWRSMLWTFDRVVVPTGFVAALIRLGNLMNHEIYGGVTDQPWGFRFISNVGAYMQGADPLFTPPCHPTQLYEAACYLAIFGICMWMYWRMKSQYRPGLIFGVFLTLVFGSRFLIEYVKNVQENWEIAMRATWGIDQGQLLSIPFVVLGVWLIVRALVRPKVEPVDFKTGKK